MITEVVNIHKTCYFYEILTKCDICIIWCLLLMEVLSEIRSTICMALSIISNSEALPMVLEGLEKLYKKSGSCVNREDPKVL